mmetsp:Transcript_50147/g.166047  ORF Transcript_50147/g.166047 Transcript_50147/m.166047 type:complete len:258 (-) Transcript_50147:62-835(-)
MESPPAKGAAVVLHSLVGRAELNGKHGVVKMFDASRGRVAVTVEGKGLSVRPENLALADREASLVAALQALCVAPGPGWHSAKELHSRLLQQSEWAGVSLQEVKRGCTVLAQSAPPAANGTVADAAASETEAAEAGAAADPAARVATLLEVLRASRAGSEERRAAVEELLALLKAHGSSRSVVNALVDGEGPQTLYAIENSMQGDWHTDARNGTLTRIGEIVRLSGPVGLAVSRYRAMSTRKVEAAVAGMHDGCEHD